MGCVPDLPAMNVYETLEAHTNAKHWNASCEIADRIA